MQALHNLKFLSYVYIFLSVYATTHSAISLGWAKHINYYHEHPDEIDPDGKGVNHPNSCNVITDNIDIDAYFWLMIMLTNYLFWQYPIFFICRPQFNKNHNYSTKKKNIYIRNREEKGSLTSSSFTGLISANEN